MLGIKALKNNRGNAVLSVLSLMAVAVGAIQISYQNSLGGAKNLKQFKTSSTRSALVANIRDSASMVATYRSSMNSSLPLTENSDLKACILGNTEASCHAGVELPVSLYSAVAGNDGSGSSLRKISGSGPENSMMAAPVLYTTNGVPCVASSDGQYQADCTTEVFTTFKATCAGGAEYCAAADSISVRYLIRSRGAAQQSAVVNFMSLASVDQTTGAIARNAILPSLISSSSTNIAVGTLSTPSITTTTTQPTTTVDPYAGLNPDIVKAVLAAGFSGTEIVTNIVKHLETLKITDLDFITAVGSVYPYNSWYSFNVLVDNLLKYNVTDLNVAKFLSEADASDSVWMKLLIDSGDYTNPFLAEELYWENVTSPEQYKAMVQLAAAAGMGNYYVTLDILGAGVTDVNIAKQLYSIFMKVDDWFISDAILGAGYTDPTKVTQILSATADVYNSFTRAGITSLGITDKTLANNLASIVSGIADTWIAGDLIKESGGDPEKLKSLVAAYVPVVYTTVATTTPVVTETTTTAETTTTTTTTTTTDGTTTVAPTDVSLISTCTDGQCPTISF